MGACTMADVLRGATGSGAIGQGEAGELKMCLQGLTGPASYDITAGSVASFADTGLTRVLGAVPIADTGAAASVIRTLRYQPAASGAPATGTIRGMDGAAGANVETPNATDLSTIVQTWLGIGS